MVEPCKGRWSDLRLRLASAAVIVPIAAFCVWSGGAIYDAMILLAMVGLVWEGATLAGVPLKNWRGALILLWPVAAGASAWKGDWRAVLAIGLTGYVFGNGVWISILVSVVGGLSLFWLRHLGYGFHAVAFVIAVVVASDSFAYLSGRVFGGPKLAPAISPGKTRSGALGGLVGAACAGGLVAWLSGLGHVPGAVGWGGVLGVFSQSGDLVESAAKRRLGVKDSGRLIPGHGGLLDRFDGLLAAAPVAALVSLLMAGQPFWFAGLAGLSDVTSTHGYIQESLSHD